MDAWELKGGSTYQNTTVNSYICLPQADKDSHTYTAKFVRVWENVYKSSL